MKSRKPRRFEKLRRFEALENRRCLSASVAVTDGGLVVSGDADGAVEIAAVSAGAYPVTDNGVLIADETTLQGVTDDIQIKLEETVAGSNDTVTVDLGGQTVDISDTAVIGGETDLGLGEQSEYGGGCGSHEHGIGHDLGDMLGTLALRGRNLGFFYRGFRR